MKIKQLVLLGIVAMLLVAIGYAASFLPAAVVLAATQPSAPIQSVAPAAGNLGTLADFETALENIYAQVNPSVVAIDVIEGPSAAAPRVPGARPGPQPLQPQSALGSGFVWDTQGHIVTNNHVIDGATKITVTLSDGTTADAKLVGADPAADLAVIQVNLPASALRPVQIADSTQVKVGQFAIAIGNPYGEENTMTTGIISALGRSLPSSDNTTQGAGYTIPDVIQTDAPINPGNSGGVLLNADGKVIGVTAAIESGSGASAGIGFAIPSAIVQKVIPALIKSGHYDHPYLGISGTTLNVTLAQAMNLKADQRGALVATVLPNGPAAKAGLRGGTQQTTADGTPAALGGDVITAIDGQPVKVFDDLVAYLARSTDVNQTVTLTILRDGKEQTVKVILLARPVSTSQIQDSGNGNLGG